MKIIKVRTKKHMKAFLRLPQKLFGDNPCYVPPLWADEKYAYTAKNNPILKNSSFDLFLLLDNNGQSAGRIIAYIDNTFNRHCNAKTGFFGSFECIDDCEAAALLLSTAESWLSARGMDKVRGPINPVAENWGFLLKGYGQPPVYLAPWNPEYYHVFLMAIIKQKTFSRTKPISMADMIFRRVSKDSRSVFISAIQTYS